jgi:hypothetical protein
MVAASRWSALKTMTFRAFQVTQRTATLAMWAVVPGLPVASLLKKRSEKITLGKY